MVFKSFIPKYVNNRVVLFFYDLLGKATNWITQNQIRENEDKNLKALADDKYIYIEREQYIENQQELENIRFGTGKRSNMQYSGCGIIAVYNALVYLQQTTGVKCLVSLISEFETNGAVMNGNFGISPYAIASYFVRQGFCVKMLTSKDRQKTDEFGERNKVIIATVYNDKNDITQKLHTVCITCEHKMLENYVIHNAYCYDEEKKVYTSKNRNYTTLSDAITDIRGNSAHICIIGIS